MRHQKRVLSADEFRVGKIGDVFAQLSAVERIDHCSSVYDLLARKVEETCAFFEIGQRVGVDKASGAIEHWDVQRYVVRTREKRLHVIHLFYRAGQAPCGLDGYSRVITHNFHTKI